MKDMKSSQKNLEKKSEELSDSGLTSKNEYKRRKYELDITEAKKQIDEFLKKGEYEDDE